MYIIRELVSKYSTNDHMSSLCREQDFELESPERDNEERKKNEQNAVIKRTRDSIEGTCSKISSNLVLQIFQEIWQ